MGKMILEIEPQTTVHCSQRLSLALADVHLSDLLPLELEACTTHWTLPERLYCFYRLSYCVFKGFWESFSVMWSYMLER